MQRNLSRHALTGRFAAIVAHGDYAEGKPAPEPFLLAARRLGIPPEHCLALEDSHHGVLSASSAGMMTIMIPDTVPATDEHRSLCVAVLDDLHAVERLVAATFGTV